MDRPFVILTPSLASGILLVEVCPAVPELLSSLAAAAVLTAVLAHRHGRMGLRFALILFATLLAGSWSAVRALETTAAASRSSAQALTAAFARYSPDAQNSVRIRGHLTRDLETTHDSVLLVIAVHSCRFEREYKSVSGLLRVSAPLPSTGVPSDLPRLYGDGIQIDARLRRPRSFRNEAGFDRAAYLRRQGIFLEGRCKTLLTVKSLPEENGGIALFKFAARLRQRIRDSLSRPFPGEQGAKRNSCEGLLHAMLLGDRRGIDHSVSEPLQATGLYHIVAISGLHVGTIGFIIFFVTRACAIRFPGPELITTVLLVGYAVLTGGRPSTIRATIMACTYLLGRLGFRKANVFNSLFLAGFIILLFDPLCLKAPGFLLTFSATLFIVGLTPRLLEIFHRLPKYFAGYLALTLAAGLGSAPLLAYFFHRLSPAGLFLNALAVPYLTVMLVGGILIVVFSPLPLISSTLAWLLEWFTRIFLETTAFIAELPGAALRVPTPSPFLILAFYASTLALFWTSVWSRPRWKWSTLFALCLSLFSLSGVPDLPDTSAQQLRLSMLDVGQGESMLIAFPEGQRVILDGGGFPGSDYDVGEQVVSPVLWHRGYRSLDQVWLSHAHADHVSGLFTLSGNFRSDLALASVLPKGDPLSHAFRLHLNELKIPYRTVRRGNKINLGKVAITSLHPATTAGRADYVRNDDSMVLLLEYGGRRVLLCGDAETKAEEEMILTGAEDLACDVLKVGHHGGRTSAGQAFLQAASPKIALISAGRGNIYGHPSPDTLQRLARKGTRIFSTHRDGQIDLTVTREGKIEVRTFTGREIEIER